MINAIDEQIKCITAEMNDQHFLRQVQKTIKNEETGDTSRHIIEQLIRKMWWKSSEKILIELSFANKVLKIGNKSSIIVMDISELVPTFMKIQQAIQAGEMDAILQATLDGRKRGRKTGKPVGAVNGASSEPVAATTSKPTTKPVK